MASATDFSSISGNFIPAGVVIPFAGASAPSGWLLCNGSAVSRTTYAALFAAIASAWGYGDNSTTFNLPDLRGRFLRGRNANGSVVNESVADAAARTACSTGGNTAENVGSVQEHKFLNHNHSSPVHNHAVAEREGGGGNQVLSASVAVNGFSNTYNSSYTGVTIDQSTTGGTESRPVNAYVNYIIKF